MLITEYLSRDRIRADMKARTKPEALQELAEVLAGSDGATPDISEIFRVLSEREQLASTGIGGQVAIPHGKLEAAGRLRVALARSRTGVDFESVDGQPAHLFFVLVAPEDAAGTHLKALARISRLCRDAALRAELINAGDEDALYAILEREDAKYGDP